MGILMTVILDGIEIVQKLGVRRHSRTTGGEMVVGEGTVRNGGADLQQSMCASR